MKNNDLLEKTTVSKSRSMSILIKEKISIALGKTTQNRENSRKKATHGSYLSKERSSSLKSLHKTKNTSSKNSSQIIQKLSFYEQTPNKTKNLNQSRKQQTQRPKTSLSSHQSQSYSDRQSFSLAANIQNFDQVMWIDSRQRKFKIINKNVKTLGQEYGTERYVEYCVTDGEKDQVMVKIKGDTFSLVDNGSVRYLAKCESRSHILEQLSYGKQSISMKVNFQGLIFLYHNKMENKSSGHEIFSFLVSQINKLKDDGLKQFPIITKIVKRLIEEQYNFQTQEYYLLLMKVQGSLPLKKQKVLDTQKLISQKLQCIGKVSGYQNTKKIGQSLFNRKKFME